MFPFELILYSGFKLNFTAKSSVKSVLLDLCRTQSFFQSLLCTWLRTNRAGTGSGQLRTNRAGTSSGQALSSLWAALSCFARLFWNGVFMFPTFPQWCQKRSWTMLAWLVFLLAPNRCHSAIRNLVFNITESRQRCVLVILPTTGRNRSWNWNSLNQRSCWSNAVLSVCLSWV